MNQVTAVVKTFERPHALQALVESIREYYPDLKILVADDSREPYNPVPEDKLVYHYPMPFDSGLSAGRNMLVGKVKTKYTLLLDDDFVFNDNTDIARLKDALDRTDFDLIAGSLPDDRSLGDFKGKFRINGDTLECVHKSVGQTMGIPEYHFVVNFFLARSKALKSVQWDEDLKVAEHIEFFYRAHRELKIGHIEDVRPVNTRADYNDGFYAYRQRAQEYTRMWMKKHGFTTFYPFHQGKTVLEPISDAERNARENTRKRMTGLQKPKV